MRPAVPPRRWPGLLRTHVCTLIATLHDGPVDACNQPRAQEAADEQPGEAGTQAQQHIVEKQEVVEVVEGSPADRSRQEVAVRQNSNTAALASSQWGVNSETLCPKLMTSRLVASGAECLPTVLEGCAIPEGSWGALGIS